VTTLEDAVARSVRPGDSVLVMMGHSRWTAAARELARQFWRTDPAFTLIMTSLGALGGAFFRGGLVSKVVTAYSGNSFPTYNPNPIFRQAYESGEVEVEHWSILTLSQRLEAAARGLPAAVTGSLVGSSMADNEAFAVVDSPFGPLGLLQPLVPDVALVHAAAADPSGNLVFSEPLLDGVWGAWAARRGVVATVERVVDDLEGLGHRVRVPGHRVLAVVEAPFGAHPGGCYAPALPVRSYGEDVAHWSAAADAAAKRELYSYLHN
jgi:acyl CoA:acetate/3-ketoacid CoA transferase alpha subunit